MATTKKYEEAPIYSNQYENQIKDLSQGILNREPFSYDAEADPVYQQYKSQYMRNGRRAMEDTLGQVSARTGGLANSYASAASQQAYDNYMSALSDKIPELSRLAYSMYQDEGDRMRNNLSMLQALEQGEYGKYQDILAQWNADRNYDYTLGRDEIADKRYEDELAYNRGRDELADKRYEDELAYNRDRDTLSDTRYKEELAYNRNWQESQRDYEKKLQTAQTLGAAGDFSGYKALGYTDAQIAAMKAAYNKQQTVSSGYSSSGSGSKASSGSSSAKSSGSSSKASSAASSALKAVSAAANIAGNIAKIAAGTSKTGIPAFSSYDSAVKYMNQNNIKPAYGQRPMTQAEWTKARREGEDGAEFEGSYSDYLTYFVRYSAGGR